MFGTELKTSVSKVTDTTKALYNTITGGIIFLAVWFGMIILAGIGIAKGKGEWRKGFLTKVIPITKTLDLVYQGFEKLLRRMGKKELAYKIDDFFDTINKAVDAPTTIKEFIDIWSR